MLFRRQGCRTRGPCDRSSKVRGKASISKTYNQEKVDLPQGEKREQEEGRPTITRSEHLSQRRPQLAPGFSLLPWTSFLWGEGHRGGAGGGRGSLADYPPSVGPEGKGLGLTTRRS